MPLRIESTARHPSTIQLARWFVWEHLPAGSKAQVASESCAGLAERMINRLDDGEELWAGLRHLLEAKDCFVRQAILDEAPASEVTWPTNVLFRQELAPDPEAEDVTRRAEGERLTVRQHDPT